MMMKSSFLGCLEKNFTLFVLVSKHRGGNFEWCQVEFGKHKTKVKGVRR